MAGTMNALEHLWRAAALPAASLQHLTLSGTEPVLASSFAVGTAAQAALAAAALVATDIGALRNGLRQQVRVDMRRAALECLCRFAIDGRTPEVWDKVAGLYACRTGAAAGWVRLHTNFAHHRDGVLQLLGLPTGAGTTRQAVADALRSCEALEFEQAAADAGLVVAALRSVDAWDRHPQAAAIARMPLVSIERIGDAPRLPWPALPRDALPLSGLRVLDLTRILAGPVAGRTLAAYGADVMLVNAPNLPNIEAIADTSRGKLSALADLRDAHDHARFIAALQGTHVFAQGYRPGALAAFGLGPDAVARARPGIVAVSLSAYGDAGPWAARRGFASLVQTATGFNDAEARAAGVDTPKPLPAQLLDMASGFLMAFGAQAALSRQQAEGGSWHVRVSLARTGLWLRSLGRIDDGFSAPTPDLTGLMETRPSGFGALTAMRHAAEFSHTPPHWARPAMPPGSHPLAWPAS